MRQRARSSSLVLAAALALAGVVACTDDDAATTSTAAPTTTTTAGGTGSSTSAAGGDAVTAGEPFPAARCAVNKAAGPIRFLSGFDFAATASIIDLVVAQQAGYYKDLCLDVKLQPSFSTANYPLLAGGEAEIAGGGSFSEVVDFATTNKVDLVALDVEGRTAIDSLIVKPGKGAALADLKGTTIGVKGKLPPSVAVMLAQAGLVEGTDYQTVGLDGFDPVAHYNLDGIVGFPGYKSNEVGTLDRAGLKYTLFDPTTSNVPGSFGVLYATKDWVNAHPTAAQDFLRATMKGLADALADPDKAVQAALDLVQANGNPNFLSTDGETFRWSVESKLVQTAAGTGLGVPQTAPLQGELDAYAKVGLFGGKAPDAATYIDAAPIAGVYDGATVIWPTFG